MIRIPARLVPTLIFPVLLPAQGPRMADVTFSEHVAPVIFHHCTSCHRPTAIAPLALTNYQETRRGGRMIKRVTGDRFMPLLHPVPGHGEFEDSRGNNEVIDQRELADAQERNANLGRGGRRR